MGLEKLHRDNKCRSRFGFKPTELQILTNNAAARAAAKLVDNDTFLADLCYENSNIVKNREAILTNEATLKEVFESDIVGKIISYDGAVPAIVTYCDTNIVLPPKCTFILSDISSLEALCNGSTKFDVIVVDPPWPNKSVKRKKGYCWLSEDDLATLPIPELANTSSLVMIWTTNNEHQKTLVKDTFFPKWGVEFYTEWHWLKITTSGEPVTPLDSQHKQSYENIILGKMPGSEVQLPQDLVFSSVPSSIHSHKPPISELLAEVLPDGVKCIELFARSLQTNWTSWGNEVLKLQQLKYYTST